MTADAKFTRRHCRTPSPEIVAYGPLNQKKVDKFLLKDRNLKDRENDAPSGICCARTAVEWS